MSLTIEEVNIARKHLECEIDDLIQDFMKHTSCVITDVFIGYQNVQEVGDKGPTRIFTGVCVDVEVNR